MNRPQPRIGRRAHGAAEALRRGEIRDGDSDVVEHPGEATVGGNLRAGDAADAHIARLARAANTLVPRQKP